MTQENIEPTRIPPIDGIIIGVGVSIAPAGEPEWIFGVKAPTLEIIPAAPDIIELRRAALPDQALPAEPRHRMFEQEDRTLFRAGPLSQLSQRPSNIRDKAPREDHDKWEYDLMHVLAQGERRRAAMCEGPCQEQHTRNASEETGSLEPPEFPEWRAHPPRYPEERALQEV